MPSSHPPTLITLARRMVRKELDLPRGSKILVAVSGGPDSMALLHVLSKLANECQFRLHAFGVDHGLRPEAPEELALAQAFATKLDVPFDQTAVTVLPGGNLQARAREARYGALEAAAAKVAADWIATAHHGDDRAETFLLRLLRGAGPRGLAVMPPRAGRRIRPFLRARRADILGHIHRHGIPFATDPSNGNPRFTRVRVRRDLLPLLEELNPAIVDHLCALADMLGEVPAPVPLPPDSDELSSRDLAGPQQGPT
jgi:tRNA(Ile)-lysidine synthase